MLETALEKFPKNIELPDGLRCEVRPLREHDERAFQEFHVQIPEDERMFVKHRVTDRAVFHEWCQHIDYESNLPLLALAGEQVIGEGTLHQRGGGWKRHIGLVSVLVSPEYRDRGIARMLIDELVEIGRHCGLARLEAEFNGERAVAIRSFAECGFRELVRLPEAGAGLPWMSGR